MSDPGAPLAERVVAGVKLDKYASVHAAVGDGFPLDVVLRHENIPIEAWDAIETAWAKALRESAKGEGYLVVAYDEQLLAAKDRMWRAIPPIDQDVRAWFDFFRHWAAAEEPFAFLAKQRMNLGDFTRLHRRWSKKIEEDSALRREAFDALCADLGPLPAVEPAPAVLPPPREGAVAVAPPPPPPPPPDPEAEPPVPSLAVPLPPPPDEPAPRVEMAPIKASVPPPSRPPPANVAPWSRPPPPVSISPMPRSYRLEADEPAPSAAAAKLTLATYASLCAELEVFPEASDRAYGKYGLHHPLARQAERASWEAHLASNPEAQAEWKEHYEHFLSHWSTMKRSRKGG